MKLQTFTFNMYQENTFVISDESGDCVIVDPGCYTDAERDALTSYISDNNLTVKYLLNTHGHIDHMLGNAFVVETYKVPFATHADVIPELESVPAYAKMMGMNPDPSPHPDVLLEEGDMVEFGGVKLEVLFTPGHSAGHISFFHRESESLFSGDVLFMGSIGRTDLPGGHYPTLMKSIFDKLLTLEDSVTVYCGHGPATSIGRERLANPFILQEMK